MCNCNVKYFVPTGIIGHGYHAEDGSLCSVESQGAVQSVCSGGTVTKTSGHHHQQPLPRKFCISTASISFISQQLSPVSSVSQQPP